MIKSMTGYGKAECRIGQDKYIFEIRSVNGKNADVSLKTSVIPRDKESEVRSFIASALSRGSIDLFATVERAEEMTARNLNRKVVHDYLVQIRSVAEAENIPVDESALLPVLVRMPDIFEQKSAGELSDEQWNQMYSAIKESVAALALFREREGESLRKDVMTQVDKIESYVCEVEKYERERIDNIRGKIMSRLEELSFEPDRERLEQEMIYYVEKLDINEEKVRLRQHCKYFRETAEEEDFPGRKLGFIAQEMGREINTVGSKANHAEIQKWVVKMKDELEKIKEQTLNIL